ncbi:YfhO family protein [Dysgonomonas sp. 520]|uniref:YfhO family protein n=1 Tax=Dysgonomonas sp. 520 TaxID=2302931 RepID=UPI0013D6C1EB|nr:YfhO family protein [Dysgonomonas sp. 520]NDW10829.1 hypothetical protein [Dysgonomonas sp. 520]
MMINEKKKNEHFILFLLILAFLSILMIFCYHPENKLYQIGDDVNFHYRRIGALIESLSNGTFPVYIDNSAANGMGYATKWFYSDFLLIPFALIAKYTSIAIGYKSLIFVITFLCGLFTFKLTKRVYNNNFAAYISAIVYTFSYYRLFDLYNRSALGEAISFTFLPIVFLGLYEVIKGDYKKWYILTIGFSLLLLSHLLSSFMTAIFVIIFIIIYYKDFLKNTARIKYLIIAGLVTIPIVAYAIFPMFEQMLSNEFYLNSKMPYNEKLPITTILKGMAGGFTPNQFEFLPGIGIILTIMVISRIFIKKSENKYLKSADISTIIGLICIILTASFVPWARFPLSLISTIQFPWRLLEFSTFLLSVSGGLYLSVLIKKRKYKYIAMGVIISASLVLITINSYNYLNSPDLNYELNQNNTIRNPKPITDNNFHLGNLEYVSHKFPSYPSVRFPNTEYMYDRSKEIKTEKNSIVEKISEDDGVGVYTYNITIKEKDNIEFPKLYYKGYSATMNGKNIPVEESNEGLIEISAEESGQLKLWYGGTFIQKISLYITGISILALCLFVYLTGKKKKKTE